MPRARHLDALLLFKLLLARGNGEAARSEVGDEPEGAAFKCSRADDAHALAEIFATLRAVCGASGDGTVAFDELLGTTLSSCVSWTSLLA